MTLILCIICIMKRSMWENQIISHRLDSFEKYSSTWEMFSSNLKLRKWITKVLSTLLRSFSKAVREIVGVFIRQKLQGELNSEKWIQTCTLQNMNLLCNFMYNIGYSWNKWTVLPRILYTADDFSLLDLTDSFWKS